MAKAAIQSTVLTSNGGIAIGGGAQVTVKDSETGSLVILWEERAGSTVKANPFNADSDGHFLVYANPGTVDIEVVSGSYTRTIKYFPIFVIGGVQNNYTGDGAPTVNDDASAGYSQGSLWFDTTSSPKEVYRCVDATTGAADWLNTTLEVGELGSAAVQDVGTTIGDVVQLEDVAGSPGLPAVDGAQLTGVTAETGSTASVVTITPGSDADYTLSAAENAATVRVLETGSWAAGHSLIGDDADREFTVINNSGFTATITTDGTTPTTVDVLDGETRTIVTRAGVGAAFDYPDFVANDSRVKTALNASGDATIYACRAWVNFDGTGTVAIKASGNVSSITDTGTGIYTVNFTTAMPDANYSISSFVGPQSFASNYSIGVLDGTLAAGSFNISTLSQSSGSPTRTDFSTVCVAVFR